MNLFMFSGQKPWLRGFDPGPTLETSGLEVKVGDLDVDRIVMSCLKRNEI